MEGPLIHVVGARPNFMKAAPVVEGLHRRGVEQRLVHTGQHYDQAMSDVFFRDLGLPEPDANLGVGSGSHARQTGALMAALEEVMLESQPRSVIVYGDVNSTLAAALVASKLLVPVAHVEAGLRSFDRTMPEEINRLVTDALASYHFVTSPEGLAHLANEGLEVESMFFVGNPMIDTLLRFRNDLDGTEVRARLGLETEYAVATVHRPSNVDEQKSAARVIASLRSVSDLVPVVLPLHPRGRETLMAAGLGETDRLRVVEPLGYLEFVALMKEARLVLTDSGGIQEETTVLGVPCLTLRETTERPITITHGTNHLVGQDPETVGRTAAEALERQWEPRTPPLWDGRAGERIAAILAERYASDASL